MALDAIGLIGGKDRLQEINMRLEQSHLSYLQMDDSPLKLQARHKLEGFIKEYLCHVPNERKYVFQETAEILHRSAATVKDFSGYRACTAWSAISLYAANLLSQPWRKEYRTLRTYSGYYKHEIEANLIGAELMFELMGYKHTGLGVLTLEGPIDPDKVSSVSRDAIVAFVECQILKEIWESVSKSFTITWLDVLDFRWNSVGSSEQAIRALSFRFMERLHQIREKTCGTSYRDHRHVNPMAMDGPPLTGLSPSCVPYHHHHHHQQQHHHHHHHHPMQMANNYNTSMLSSVCKPDSVYPSDGNFYFTPVEATNRFSNVYACPVVAQTQPRYYQSSLSNTGILSSIPGHATRVPTARLIELDTPVPVANYERNLSSFNELSASKPSKSRNHDTTDEVDFRRSQSSENERAHYARIEKRAGKLSRSTEESTSHDWSFVYKSLEDLGYSKDLGERDDVLRHKELMHDTKNSSKTLQKTSKSLINVDQDDRCDKNFKKRSIGLKETNFNDTTVSNGQENRTRDHFGVRKKNSMEIQDLKVGLDDHIDDKNYTFVDKGKKYSSNTLPNVRGNIGKNNDIRNDGIRESKNNDTKVIERRWNCAFCTFLNSNGREICEMCGKSKKKGNEDKPLASGGKECPKCTLVNEKNASSCEACSTSLKDSPTYI